MMFLAGALALGLIVSRVASGQSRHDEGDGTSQAPPGSDLQQEEGEPPPDESASAAASIAAPPASAPRVRVSLPIKDGMVRLPGGRFVMGSGDPKAPPNEGPPHGASVAAFWIDRTEVTVAAYRACVEQSACAPPDRASPTCTFDLGDPLLPISCVRWQDADAYCHSVGKRLPRETEWEFAARGGSRGRFPWGGNGTTCGYAVTLYNDITGRGCGHGRPARVGTHLRGASWSGVLDMSGNVEEWTSDWYAENISTGAMPRAGASHVLRGGGWLSGPSASRTTSRSWGSALEAGPNVGFRCARTASDSP